jgi:tetratricopeptide (TPR) repeat protein
MGRSKEMKTIYKLSFLISFFIITGLVKAQNYDYLIITPDVFINQYATWDDDLLDLQTSRGFNPVIEAVTVQTTAQQIKNLIQTYYNNNPLQYVLLMGNAKNLIPVEDEPDTTIPYQYREHGIINEEVDYVNGTYIPFFSVWSVNPWNPNGGLNVATDDPYVSDLTSHGPVYIGRVPVTSVMEANNYVSKLITYYQSLDTYSEANNREILLNLDVTWENGGCTGELVQYISNNLVNNHIPSSTTVVELNVSENDPPGCTGLGYCSAREQDFEEELNQGAAVMTILGTIGGPRNFGGWYWDISSFNLSNKTTGMPFVFAANCHQGEVNNPDYESTMRKLMVHNNGGIIGAIAPTEGTEQHANGHLLSIFNDLLFQDNTPSYGEIFKILKEELFANFSWLEFYNNGLTYFGDPSMTPSIYKHRSGYVASSATWSGNFVIDESIIIPPGGNLTILPGSNLFFRNNSFLEAFNPLYAVGTHINKIKFDKDDISETWGPLLFMSSYASSSVLDNVIVKNCSGIQCSSGADVTIKNSLIDYGYHGIYIYNSAPHIIDNTIIEPYGNGIYGEANGKSPLIKGNTIKKITRNPNNFQGIYLLNFTNPFITNNDIQGFAYGIYYGGGGSGIFTDGSYSTPIRNNRLTNNNSGLAVAWGSYLIAGSNNRAPAYFAHNNSIYDNNNADALVYQSGTVIGKQNWWGSNPIFVVTSNGYLDASNPLLSDPWEGIQRQQRDDEQMPMIFRGGDSTGIDDIIAGLDLEYNNNISEAVKHYKKMIRDISHPKFALGRLAGINNRFSINNILNYLEILLNTNISFKPAVLNIIAGMYLDANRYEDAMQLYDLIILGYTDSYDATNALFEKFFAALHYKNDLSLASQLLSQLQSLNYTDEDFLMRLAVAELMLNGTSSNRLLKGRISDSKNNDADLPKEYSLLGNFPNPFNPTTTISYALPFNSSIELIIYDIMGAKVKSFVIPSQSSGYQKIVWDGKNENGNLVSSGAYLYRIVAKSLENNEVFVKAAKLMLLK